MGSHGDFVGILGSLWRDILLDWWCWKYSDENYSLILIEWELSLFFLAELFLTLGVGAPRTPLSDCLAIVAWTELVCFKALLVINLIVDTSRGKLFDFLRKSCHQAFFHYAARGYCVYIRVVWVCRSGCWQQELFGQHFTVVLYQHYFCLSVEVVNMGRPHPAHQNWCHWGWESRLVVGF